MNVNIQQHQIVVLIHFFSFILQLLDRELHEKLHL